MSWVVCFDTSLFEQWCLCTYTPGGYLGICIKQPLVNALDTICIHEVLVDTLCTIYIHQPLVDSSDTICMSTPGGYSGHYLYFKLLASIVADTMENN